MIRGLPLEVLTTGRWLEEDTHSQVFIIRDAEGTELGRINVPSASTAYRGPLTFSPKK
jgi:hypothetical protein